MYVYIIIHLTIEEAQQIKTTFFYVSPFFLRYVSFFTLRKLLYHNIK